MGCVKIPGYRGIHHLTTSALTFFEFLLTIDKEVRLFWGKKLTGAVALFFTNRYTTLIYTIYYMFIELVPARVVTAQVSYRLFFVRALRMRTYCPKLSRGNGVLTIAVK